MEYREYKKLYNGLNTYNDIKHWHAEGYDLRLLETLHTQKVSREVKKRYHTVKKNSARMLREWKKGRTIMEIANYYQFPPVLTAMMLFQEDGASKKKFWEFVNNPELLQCDAAAVEIAEAIENDLVYSPDANDKQRERGLWGEALLWDWLNEQGIEYCTEADLRDAGGKTPDCLLKERMLYEGKEIAWIESKASFGDNVEFKFNSKKQLIPYTELFGPGVVVYWTGCLEDMECPENVYITDISLLEKKLKKME